MVYITLADFHGADYRCIIYGISKSEAINLLKNADLCKKVDHYKI